MRNVQLLRRNWVYPAMAIAVTGLVFTQNQSPVLFVILPFVVLVLTQLDLGWAAVTALGVIAIGGWSVVSNLGPLAASSPAELERSTAVLQVFLITMLTVLYSVSVVFGNLHKTQRELKQIAALHKLVVDNSRDVITLASLDGVRSYISPGIKALTGWVPEDLHGKAM
jgi:PAS domain-containing protein